MSVDREELKHSARYALLLTAANDYVSWNRVEELAEAVLELLDARETELALMSASLRQAEAERDRLQGMVEAGIDEAHELAKENNRLREAVRFYADPNHWTEEGVCEYVDPEWTLGKTEDGGWHARRALGES